MRRICHLVDDTGPGGVTRFLDFMSTSPRAAGLGTHQVIPVRAGLSRPPRPRADVILSHVVLSWRNLPFFIALRAANPRTPIVHMEHSYSPAFERLHVASTRRFRAMLGISLSLFDRVVAISTAQRDWLETGIGVSAGKLALIPPCVDLSRFLALPPPGEAIRSIGAFGRMDDQKGFDILIPAFLQAGLPGVTLDIYGDGPMRGALEALAGGSQAIRFHGFTSDPAAAMGRVDAVAMPSRREPYGLVALEAMAAGRALLVSKVDGLQDHALTGANPVDRLTVEDWAAALRALPGLTSVAARGRARQLAAGAGDRFAAGWAELLEGLEG